MVKNISLDWFLGILLPCLWIGIVSGLISGMVKIGWEVILPTRTKDRDETNPPQKLMQQIGFPQKITHAYFLYSKDQKVYWFALILHFSFSIVFSFIFVVLSQIWSGISLGEGALYGIIIWFLWHILLMPITRTVPQPWKQPFSEHFSEFFGHIVWAWSIAAVSFYMMATHYSDVLALF